ncbi:MAG TPA: GTP 3',8-cyclase MoaA, partial [Bacteroidales bacterium]|nr:GTP 3',8-cyclase MoaA [Bacteroidales bacterium]
MIDAQGRTIDYIRISVTDRCNLRCVYCMPETGMHMAAHDELMSFEEIERLCRILAELGIRKVKLTGGEPLVRKDFVELVRKIKAIDGIDKVTVTTNGVLLENHMDELASAGIDGINISLDSLDPKKFEEITRRDLFSEAYRGIQKALTYPEIPLKLNCLPLGLERQSLVDIAELARENRMHVRFIEVMPIGQGKKYEFLGENEIVGMLEEKFGKLTPYGGKLGFGPGHYYSVDGFKGKIGFISSISHKFCDSCNRIRLTSEGYLKSCLQYETGRDLRKLMRGGAKDAEIREAIIEAIEEKP